MKATIENKEGVFWIRFFDNDNNLSDIFVVESITCDTETFLYLENEKF